MEKERFVSITISLPKAFRDQLRKIAAVESLKNPERFTSISQLGRKIICGYLNPLKKEGTTHDEIGGGKESE